MPKLEGLSSCIPEIEDVTLDMIQSLIPDRLSGVSLENQLGNLLIYPQSVAVSEEDQKMEYILMKLAIKLNSLRYYQKNVQKIFIPGNCFTRFPNIGELVMLFVEVLDPKGVVTIVEMENSLGGRNVGTLIRPEKVAKNGSVKIDIANKEYEVKEGEVKRFLSFPTMVDIRFDCTRGVLIQNQNFFEREVYGGQVGIIVDLREADFSLGR